MSCARAAESPVTADALCGLFNAVFRESEHTELCAGAEEPLYTPAAGTTPARIHFRHDYPASALHEVAHWCIAGRARRTREDYGYWYEPDGRDGAAQAAFLNVEARPQALEWCFSQACAMPFRVSLDNLDAPPDPGAHGAFTDAVIAAAKSLAEEGLPPRAGRFFVALGAAFRPGFAPGDLRFDRRDLR